MIEETPEYAEKKLRKKKKQKCLGGRKSFRTQSVNVTIKKYRFTTMSTESHHLKGFCIAGC